MPFYTSCPGRSHLFGWEMGDVGHTFGLAVKEEDAFLGEAEKEARKGMVHFHHKFPPKSSHILI